MTGNIPAYTFPKEESTENKITFGHIAAFLIFLPFDRIYCELILISLLIHTLIFINKEKIKNIFSKTSLLLTGYYIFVIIGLLWTTDLEEGLATMQKQLGILLFPLILMITDLDLSKYRQTFLTIFGITCIGIIIYLYADALHIILYNHLSIKKLFSTDFINHNFSAPIGMHATYLSLYVALSLISFFLFFLSEKKKLNSFFYLLALIILGAGLVQLASRSVLIATLAVIIIIILYLIISPEKMPKKQYIILSILAILITAYGITTIDAFRKRYISEFREDLTENPINNDIPEPRIIRWKVAIKIISENIVIGHGTGSEKRLLNEQYYKNRLYNSYLNSLNAHNQYLSILIQTGLVGLLVFLLTLIAGIILSIKKLDLTFFGFMTLLAVVCFSENVLDVNKGIFFFAFFFSFFVIRSKPSGRIIRL